MFGNAHRSAEVRAPHRSDGLCRELHDRCADRTQAGQPVVGDVSPVVAAPHEPSAAESDARLLRQVESTVSVHGRPHEAVVGTGIRGGAAEEKLDENTPQSIRYSQLRFY